MPAFKLPRLQFRLSIVDTQGRPTSTFLDFFNVQFAGRLEQQVADLSAVQAELAAQLALITNAQNTADDALALANEAAGSKYIDINGAPEASTASEATLAKPDVLLNLNGTITGAILDANTDWVGEATLSETLGGTTNVLMTIPITISPNGTVLPGPLYEGDDVSFSGTAIGSLDGAITYTVEYTRISGSNMAFGGTIVSRLMLTPVAV